MASTKIKYKNQNVKKYFVGLCIILAIIFLALYFYKWHTVREQEKYINSYLIDSFTPKDDKLCGGFDGNQCPRALSE